MFSRRMRSAGLGVLATAICAGTVVRHAVADVRPHAGMLRYPDVSDAHIVFVYANDIWVVSREGGRAMPLANPKGVESFPRFTSDGKTIAFVGNYDGDMDIYTIPVEGGVPFRVTHHPATEMICGWTPDGEIVFHARGVADYERAQLFTVSPGGGMPRRLPVPYGTNAAISDDGIWMAYTPFSRDHATWKRYRGGSAADIWLFNLEDHSSKRITTWEGTDSIPMWHGEKIYFLSDAGPNARLNIWAYDTRTGEREQITGFSEFDVKWPSIGPGPGGKGEIVFQNGAELYLLDLEMGTARAVEVVIPGDRPTIRPNRVDVSKDIQAGDISATGKRVVVEARGDIWTLPAEKGVPRNLTRSSGVAERDPAWSPDGRWIAYLSDAGGEYDLYVTQSDGKGDTRKVAELGPGYRYLRHWSPDSKHIAVVQKTGAIDLCEVESGTLTQVDVDPAGREPHVSWSHDSRWLAYTRSHDNDQTAIWAYNIETGEKQQLTSGFFNDTWPTFDRKGDWLYFASNRSFTSPIYEDVGQSFVYTGTDVLVAVPLRKDVEHPWPEKNDEEKWEEKKDEDEDKDKDKDKEKDGDDDKDDGEDKEGDGDEDENGEGDQKEQPAIDESVSGEWAGLLTGHADLPPEGLPFTLKIRVSRDGSSVSGSLTGGPYVGTITGGTYQRDSGSLTLTLEVVTEEGPESFTVSASVSGESMSGTVTGEGFAATFNATRTSAEVPEEEKKDEEKKEEAREKVEIDADSFEDRALQLPVGRGAFSHLAVNEKNQLIYASRPLHGSDKSPEIKLFDLSDEKKEAKTVVSGPFAFAISADGKKLMVMHGGYAVIDAKPGQKLDKKVPLDGMVAIINPREEWQQVFVDAWRIYRDFFYVDNMHGVDWAGIRAQYAKMLPECGSRDDVAYVISEMISELNVGHAYYYGGPSESGPSVSVGLLGVDFELHDGAYRIAKIHRGGAWDLDARGPLIGTNAKEGDFLLAVNGIAPDTGKDPWAAFQGLANQVVTLTLSEKPTIDDDAREVTVKLIGSEHGLRYRSWVEANRKHVEEKTGGRVGYLHVPDTGVNGQNNLFRQFYGQRDKEALIIDERWNHGGQIPSRFIELLNRPLLNYWAIRDGRDNRTPPDAHFGPKCMLINESAGSGGDMFPALFRQVGLGKLIGTRTWGGLVGISGNPRLIDGHAVRVPTFGYYEIDGTWGIEGHGVDPDIEVIDDPALMVDGGDPQLDAAIAHMLEELERNPFVPTERPDAPVRTGIGIAEEDK